MKNPMQHNTKAGFHQFVTREGGVTERYGSFEVFYDDTTSEEEGGPGWYWWPCFPGCMPDSEDAYGPFEDSEDAYEAAQYGA